MTTDSDTAPELRTLKSLGTQVDLIALNAQAVRTSIEVVSQLTPADLAKPTPCAGWTLHGLLAHMITQHYGFAAASGGEGDLSLWRLRPLGEDPIADYRAAAEHVLASFAEDGVLDRSFPLPEFTSAFEFSGAEAVSFHLIDYVVHSWDVARTLGRTVHFDDDLLAVALSVAEIVPGGPARLAPGSAFGPVIAWSGDSVLDEIVAILGRSPSWPE
ncbi:TIGR03086 family metal-binding protein [Nocardia pseudovaccinii]|uniref:TIGR03086 family metal-binding protein n=1 Tax=Nocardia pseudovaccinii TaxID=189540 RepID=UPI0007A38126|nr:TIGR03086 family metal-binding protein [Nocardia pseudovaccinii]